MVKEQYDQENAVEGWGTSTQVLYGPPTPYRFRTTSAEFNKDMRRKGSEEDLHLVVRGLPLDVDDLTPIEDWKTHELVLKCGGGWETYDNGKSAQHKSKTVFDGRSAAGEFVDKIVSSPELRGLLNLMVERGRSTDAHAYVGLDLTIGQGPIHKTKIGEQVVEYARPIPIDYHGTFDVEEEGSKLEKQNDELIAKLTQAAIDEDDFDSFQNVAMSMGVTDSNLLEDIMNDSEDGFYETARKEAE